MQYLLFFLTNFLWNFLNVGNSRSKLSNSAVYLFTSSGAVSLAFACSLAFATNLMVEAHAAHDWTKFTIAVLLYGASGATGNLAGWHVSRGWEQRHHIERS